MSGFLVDTLVPLGAVAGTVTLVTVVAFDPPPPTPPTPSVESAPTPARAPAPRPTVDPLGDLPSGTLRPREKQMRKMTDVFREAARNLSTNEQPPKPRAEDSPEEIPDRDQNVITAVSNLGNAIQRARDAKDDKDLEAAENMLRKARQDMEASCKGGNAALCQSAERMKSLGY